MLLWCVLPSPCVLGTIFRTREGRDGAFVGGAVRLVVLGIVFDTHEGEWCSCGVCYPTCVLGTIFRTREGRDGVFVVGAVRLVVLGIVFDTHEGWGFSQ